MEASRTYSREAREAAFLLGGIGTGNVSLGSRGEFRDWEIFNKPGKRCQLPNTYFSIWARQAGKAPVAKVLESKLLPPHIMHNGYGPGTGGGLPRMDDSTMKGEYPFVWIDFEDSQLPVQVQLEAFTPFIPLNEEDSGIPGAYLTYRVRNTSSEPVTVTLAGSLMNPVGIEYEGDLSIEYGHFGEHVNELRTEAGFNGLYMHSNRYGEGDLKYGNMSLAAEAGYEQLTYKRVWYRGSWFDYLQEFWDDFAADGLLNDLGYDSPSPAGSPSTGTIGVRAELAPGECKDIRFVLAWYFPNRINGWSRDIRVKEPGREVAQNYYANQFDSSWSAASYLIGERERLTRQTAAFHDALFGSSLPRYVIESMANNLTTIRSNTCFRLKDGRFLAFEGTYDAIGSCEGNCTHVWNYAQSAAFLFPKLEQSMRRTELLDELNERGKMSFRAHTIFDCLWDWKEPGGPAAADGQLGSTLRVYREWKLSGDDQMLRELWEPLQRSMRFALEYWDTDGDLILDGQQHNTYDIEFFGPNPLTGVMLLAALKAMQKMAQHLQENELAQRYGEMFETSSKRLDELLWNGEYFVQRLEQIDEHKYQYGVGCLSDQMLAQQLAHLYGLGYLLPEAHVKSAVHAVFRYNFKEDFTDHVNCQRTYVLNDERGMTLCSWPHGGRPRLPFVYSDEVWTGVEYQVATHLVYEGFVEEALTVVRSVWERQDGYRRNPWNEIECGNHYARALASWGLLIAFSGFQFDMASRTIRFAPVLQEGAAEFAAFWSTGQAWGSYVQRLNEQGEWVPEVTVLYGDANGVRVTACGKQWILQ
ncbi:GH116 family glycosyl-hydrolase [Paenibacillus silvisoli]|uniref:GH116 family glycosyl-hydrolase n=1 Tax=Paenibacillus silvisoli TaxID=3110539 RepID=UPI002803D3EC|nr:GH116 family glycosyl-hydrolase [Paenibacillus silvisoli]